MDDLTRLLNAIALPYGKLGRLITQEIATNHGASAVPALRRALETGKAPDGRQISVQLAALALETIGDPACVPELIAILERPPTPSQSLSNDDLVAVADALGILGDERAFPGLIAYLRPPTSMEAFGRNLREQWFGLGTPMQSGPACARAIVAITERYPVIAARAALAPLNRHQGWRSNASPREKEVYRLAEARIEALTDPLHDLPIPSLGGSVDVASLPRPAGDPTGAGESQSAPVDPR